MDREKRIGTPARRRMESLDITLTPWRVLRVTQNRKFALVQVGDQEGRPWVVSVTLPAGHVSLPRSLTSVLRNGDTGLQDFDGDPEPFLEPLRRAWEMDTDGNQDETPPAAVTPDGTIAPGTTSGIPHATQSNPQS